jgi:hypothetical protein
MTPPEPSVLLDRQMVETMLARWLADERRLKGMFGPYTVEMFDEGSEMQRNLGTAIACAQQFLSRTALRARSPDVQGN